MRSLVARLRAQDGQTLILALGFITLFGIVGAGLLNFATTNLRASTNLRDLRAALFAADGAVEAAINRVRFDSAAENGNCLAETVINSQKIRVDCTRTVLNSVSTVTLVACRSNAGVCTSAPTVLEAKVTIDRSGGIVGCPVTPTRSNPECVPVAIKTWSVKR